MKRSSKLILACLAFSMLTTMGIHFNTPYPKLWQAFLVNYGITLVSVFILQLMADRVDKNET